MNLNNSVSQRRYDLDWLRIIAILTVFIFHSGRFFDKMDWHVKNAATYQGMQIWTMFLVTWMMPLIFVISGGSLYFSLGKAGKFIKDKVLRLLVPLIVGIFTHISLCVYLERLTHHQFTGSFFKFYPTYFHGMYGDGGNFAWMGLHLWYLLVLFVFSIAFMPLLYLLKGPGKKVLTWLGDIFSLSGIFYLLALPIAWIMIKTNPYSVLGERNWGGWSLLGYIPFFLYGYLVFSHAGLQKSIQHWRWVSFVLTIISTVCLVFANDRYGSSFFRSRGYAILNGLFGLSAWLWVLTILAFGMQYLKTQTRFLSYANEAVLPFYVLHQTVLLSAGYFVTDWNIPDPLKFVIISLSSSISILLIYEFLIRRFNFGRVLFGMKAKTRIEKEKPPVPSRVGLYP